jgi:5-methylcytosine-specific restriction endonuclease McrA
MRTLVLNSDWSYVNICSNFDALVMYLDGKVDIVHTYDKVLRSQYLTWKVPSIVVLRRYKDVSKRRRNASISLRYILARDQYTCCYCGCKLTIKNGNRDHVIPLSRGGPNKPNNIVATCKSCNTKKSDHTLEETGFKMRFQPKELSDSERLAVYIKGVSSSERSNWIDWLKENNVKLW